MLSCTLLDLKLFVFFDKRFALIKTVNYEEGTPDKYTNQLSDFKGERVKTSLVGDDLQMGGMKWKARALICIEFQNEVYRINTPS